MIYKLKQIKYSIIMIIMRLISHVSFLFMLLTIFGCLSLSIKAQIQYKSIICYPELANFTANSTYESNLNLLFSYLTSNATNHLGFYNTTVGGQGPGTDPVYGFFSCRGDVTPERCHECVSTIAENGVPKDCAFRKNGILWYDLCMVRYLDTSFFGNLEQQPFIYTTNTGNVTEPDRFMVLLGETMNSAVDRAVDVPKKFATKEVYFTDFQMIYTLVQCTADLSRLSCEQCLKGSISHIPDWYSGKQAGDILVPSCEIEFNISPFYTIQAAATPPPLLPSPPPDSVTRPDQGNGKISSLTIVAIAVPIAIALLLVGCLFLYLKRKTRKNGGDLLEQNENNDEMTTIESLLFKLATIEAATNRFSVANKLGGGGFGVVYKGTLPDGQEIAVKRLSKSSGQGIMEFKNEVVLVAKLQHRNLVRLLGFCSEGGEKILVYELVKNKSLDYFLSESNNRARLDWSCRYKIISGIAKGMLYLHQDCRLKIIHRDLKAGNILLDEELNPKIADFGMARIFELDQSQENTMRIVGTYGYMPPEYAIHGHFSVKTDVFSLGVLILEIVTGEKNTSFQSERGEYLLAYAWNRWREGKPGELLDRNLRRSYSRNQVIRCIHIALLCVQEDADKRPTMATVVLMLNSYSITIAVPQKPAFWMHGSEETRSSNSSDQHARSSDCSINEASITELYPR